MKKVLIVDDSENNRMVVRDALEDEGYELFEAVDGQDALERIAEHLPNLVLLDIMMPEIDGFSVLKQIKSNPDTRHINVIMLSAMKTDTPACECLDAGAIDYITKPFSNSVFRARVRSALRTDGELQPSCSAKLPSQDKMASLEGVIAGVEATLRSGAGP